MNTQGDLINRALSFHLHNVNAHELKCQHKRIVHQIQPSAQTIIINSESFNNKSNEVKE